MVSAVSDYRSNPNDQIRAAVEAVGKSDDRRKVFEAVYKGKKVVKSVEEISASTGLSAKRVLEEGKKLAARGIVTQTKINKRVAYAKDSFFSSHKNKILGLVANPANLHKLPTKNNPTVNVRVESILIPRDLVRIRMLTIDDIESFNGVLLSPPKTIDLTTLSEAKFKEGIKKIIGETAIQTDWGGEPNDLWTTRLRVAGKRISTAFAFKGPGKRGVLTPGKMGKNGDQIQTLFKNNVDLYVVQYWAQVAQTVVDLMRELAKAKSATEGREILFCMIDGQDTQRIVDSFPRHFK